jgi:glycogen(starch) synthase
MKVDKAAPERGPATPVRHRPAPPLPTPPPAEDEEPARPSDPREPVGEAPSDPDGARSDLERLSEDLSWRRAAPEPPAVAAAPTQTRRLHILMVGWEFPPHHSGGLGVHCYELCRELTRMGHRVTFLTPFPGPFTPVAGVEFRHPGDKLDETPEFPEAYWTGELEGSPFGEAIDGYNAWIGAGGGIGPVDIVHVHDWFGTVGGTELARRLHVPIVMTVHSTEYDRSLGHPWERILWRERFGVQNADAVIAVSHHLARQLEERYAARPERVRVIYNAVRPSPRLTPVTSARRTVLYLGRLAAMKGVDTFLRAAARVAPAFPDALFVVAGEGPEYPRLVDLAVHLGIADSVLFLGHVTEDERVVLLASASVFVLPSIVEPFGIAALEAMAAGVPVILSKTSGVAEMAKSVFAVDFWDTEEFASRIAELLIYPVLQSTMGEGGRADALREGWPERALQTVGVYAELLRGPGGRT